MVGSHSKQSGVEGDIRAFDLVIDYVRTSIRSGVLSAGDQLPAERKLAERLGISRASVREGIRVLQALGMVGAAGPGPYGGVRLRSQPGNELANIFEMWSALRHIDVGESVVFRELIEGWACSVAVSTEESESVLANLEQITKEMAQTYDQAGYLALDAEFHYNVVRCSGNQLAALVASAVRQSVLGHMREALQHVRDWPEVRRRLTAEHRGIYRALAAGDGNAAKEAVSTHIRTFYQGYFS